MPGIVDKSTHSFLATKNDCHIYTLAGPCSCRSPFPQNEGLRYLHRQAEQWRPAHVATITKSFDVPLLSRIPRTTGADNVMSHALIPHGMVELTVPLELFLHPYSSSDNPAWPTSRSSPPACLSRVEHFERLARCSPPRCTFDRPSRE